MKRASLTALQALRNAYDMKPLNDAQAQAIAVQAMVLDGWDGAIADAAVTAAWNANYRIMGAV